LLGLVAITAILTGPARPAEHFLELIRHGVGSFASKLGRTLGGGEILVAHVTKIEVGRRACWVLDLAFERVKPVGQLLDISGDICQYVLVAVDMRSKLPFAGPALHRLSAELASGPSPLAAGASLWSVFACRITPNLPHISRAHQGPFVFRAPSCAGTRRTPAKLWTACDLDRWDRMRRVVLPSSLPHAPSAGESA
jgi:hypothetical protein